MIYSSWNIECDSFCPFTLSPPLKTQNIRKNSWRYQKPQSCEVQLLRYRVRQTNFFVILSHFFPFYPQTTWKIKILKKWKKYLEMSSFYKCVPKIIIIWCMLPEIWSVADLILCHFGPFFALLPNYWLQKLKFGKNIKNHWRYYPFKHVYHKWRSCDVCSLRYKGTTDRVFCQFGPFFALWLS